MATTNIPRETHRQHILDGRHVQGALKLQHIVVADLGIDIAAELVARLDRREQHRAAGAAFTEQRSLRALQHLYTGQVIDLKILDCRIYVLADAAKRDRKSVV